MPKIIKLLKSANVSGSYSKNKSGTFFMDHGVLFINKLKSKINNNKQIQNKMHHVESYVRFS